MCTSVGLKWHRLEMMWAWWHMARQGACQRILKTEGSRHWVQVRWHREGDGEWQQAQYTRYGIDDVGRVKMSNSPGLMVWGGTGCLPVWA